MATKYVFVTGGVVSGLGKGISASSLAALMEAHGYSVTMLKVDPYVNVDPGTMSPFQHGEVFVTDDGAETDLDLGHYERFTDNNLSQINNLTSGRVYETILATPLDENFRAGLRAALDEAFDGESPPGLFVRSDTNVEDLAGFTGAGLNLTLPNVVGFDALLAAIQALSAENAELKARLEALEQQQAQMQAVMVRMLEQQAESRPIQTSLN